MGKTYDIAVVGSGVFGVWTAYWLRRSGRSVILLDAYGASNARASSGGESRIIRAGYGPDEVYTVMSTHALKLWHEFFDHTGNQALFQPTGVLWLASARDGYEKASLAILEKLGVRVERLTREEIEKRYPQIDPAEITWGFLEPWAGVLMARRCVQAVVKEASSEGVEYRIAAVRAPSGPAVGKSKLESVLTTAAEAISAGTFVFACGPWLPQVFPDLLGLRIFPSRQEVHFFGVPAGDIRFRAPALPTWICLGDEFYGMPDIENRGFKVAFDHHGPPINPDVAERVVSHEGLEAVRAYASRRFPALKNAPVVETRVCQYENTSNGDFLIDRHPVFDNVWLVGGGSGHGFKHGPAVGEYVAALIDEKGKPEPRFSLSTKREQQGRQVF